ncbi:metallophosphoesterase [Candidatus Dependentiae bacterium]
MKKQIIMLLSLLLAIPSQIYASEKADTEYTIQVTNSTGKGTKINATEFAEWYELPDTETISINIKKGEKKGIKKKIKEKIKKTFTSSAIDTVSGPLSWLYGWDRYSIKNHSNIESITLLPHGEYEVVTKKKKPKKHTANVGDLERLYGAFAQTPEEALDITQIIPFKAPAMTLDEWGKKCYGLPIKQWDKLMQNNPEEKALNRYRLTKTMDDFIEAIKNSSFNISKNWGGDSGPTALDFDSTKQKRDTFFAQKIIVAPGTQIVIHADIHADIHSFIKFLQDLETRGYIDNNFKIPANVIFLFLGDYTDRGYYGTEVLYTIMKLKIANPDKVILLRGNHEDTEQNKYDGLRTELQEKFDYAFDNERQTIYNLMPSVVYIGVKGTPNYALFCHGAIEPRFDPRDLLSKPGNIAYQWINKLDASWLNEELNEFIPKVLVIEEKGRMKKKIYQKVKKPLIGDIGFIWGDFLLAKGPYMQSKRGVPIVNFNHALTKQFLEYLNSLGEHQIKTIIRGHQHSGQCLENMLENHGIYNLSSDYQWDDCEKLKLEVPQYSVWTINVSPAAYYGTIASYKHDTYAILTLNKDFKNWVLEPRNIIIHKLKMKVKYVPCR